MSTRHRRRAATWYGDGDNEDDEQLDALLELGSPLVGKKSRSRLTAADEHDSDSDFEAPAAAAAMGRGRASRRARQRIRYDDGVDDDEELEALMNWQSPVGEAQSRRRRPPSDSEHEDGERSDRGTSSARPPRGDDDGDASDAVGAASVVTLPEGEHAPSTAPAAAAGGVGKNNKGDARRVGIGSAELEHTHEDDEEEGDEGGGDMGAWWQRATALPLAQRREPRGDSKRRAALVVASAAAFSPATEALIDKAKRASLRVVGGSSRTASVDSVAGPDAAPRPRRRPLRTRASTVVAADVSTEQSAELPTGTADGLHSDAGAMAAPHAKRRRVSSSMAAAAASPDDSATPPPPLSAVASALPVAGDGDSAVGQAAEIDDGTGSVADGSVAGPSGAGTVYAGLGLPPAALSILPGYLRLRLQKHAACVLAGRAAAALSVPAGPSHHVDAQAATDAAVASAGDIGSEERDGSLCAVLRQAHAARPMTASGGPSWLAALCARWPGAPRAAILRDMAISVAHLPHSPPPWLVAGSAGGGKSAVVLELLAEAGAVAVRVRGDAFTDADSLLADVLVSTATDTLQWLLRAVGAVTDDDIATALTAYMSCSCRDLDDRLRYLLAVVRWCGDSRLRAAVLDALIAWRRAGGDDGLWGAYPQWKRDELERWAGTPPLVHDAATLTAELAPLCFMPACAMQHAAHAVAAAAATTMTLVTVDTTTAPATPASRHHAALAAAHPSDHGESACRLMGGAHPPDQSPPRPVGCRSVRAHRAGQRPQPAPAPHVGVDGAGGCSELGESRSAT